MIDVGAVCRSSEPIIKTAGEDDGRICRVVAPVPPERWRQADVPEYKVELLTMAVTAFRREADLQIITR